METVDTSSLDLSEDADYERRRRWVTRAGRTAVALIVVAALAGLAGPGPLSTARLSADGLTVETDRFARLQAPLTLRVWLPPGDRTVALTRSYADAFEIESVRPAPTAERTSRTAVVFDVDVEGAQPAPVVFHLRPLRFGHVAGHVALPDGRRVLVEHWVLP